MSCIFHDFCVLYYKLFALHILTTVQTEQAGETWGRVTEVTVENKTICTSTDSRFTETWVYFMPMYITADRMSDYERAGVLVNEWRLWTWKMNLKRQQLESR